MVVVGLLELRKGWTESLVALDEWLLLRGSPLLTCRYGESWLRPFQRKPSLSLSCPMALGSVGLPRLGIWNILSAAPSEAVSSHGREMLWDKASAMTGQRDRLVTESSGVFHSFGTKFRMVLEWRKWNVSSHQAMRTLQPWRVGGWWVGCNETWDWLLGRPLTCWATPSGPQFP